jgi:hypothetical protein
MMEQKEQILKQIVRDAPVFAMAQQPGMALQLIMGLRQTIETLKELDEGYEFKSSELPTNLPSKSTPDYIG